ncbi:MAG: acyl-CoA dehydrogenase family protein, partial [Bdellovibrionales bacterium]|nr:acyl-CoA dehydrogenase family protein [Bdellovibrionales bacterium]
MLDANKSDQKNSIDTLDPEASVVKTLFLGNIIEENLAPFPAVSTEEAETLRMVIESIDRFLEENRESFRKWDVEGYQPEEYIDSLKELGLFGLVIPEEHGGIGLSSKGYARVLQQSSRYDGSTSLTIG